MKILKNIDEFIKSNCGNFAFDEEIGTEKTIKLKNLTIICEYTGYDWKYGEAAFEASIFNNQGILLGKKRVFTDIFSVNTDGKQDRRDKK